MKGLYKGKYIIAIYDENDDLIEVACKPEELKFFKNKRYLLPSLNRYLRTNTSPKHTKLYFIDCTEKHDDIFAEEDEIFLDFVKSELFKTQRELAKELGVSLGTYRKYKNNGTLYKLEDKIRRKHDD